MASQSIFDISVWITSLRWCCKPLFGYEVPTCSSALHSLPLHHSSSLGHFSFEAHLSPHFSSSPVHPSYRVSGTSFHPTHPPPLLLTPSLLEMCLQAKNLHSSTINLGLCGCCYIVPIQPSISVVLLPVLHCSLRLPSHSPQLLWSIWSFHCLRTGWDLRAGLLRISNCGLCVRSWLPLLLKSKCLPFVACSGIPSVTPRLVLSGGMTAPSQRKLSFSAVNLLPQIHHLTPCDLQNYTGIKWISAFKTFSLIRRFGFFYTQTSLFLYWTLHFLGFNLHTISNSLLTLIIIIHEPSLLSLNVCTSIHSVLDVWVMSFFCHFICYQMSFYIWYNMQQCLLNPCGTNQNSWHDWKRETNCGTNFTCNTCLHSLCLGHNAVQLQLSCAGC